MNNAQLGSLIIESEQILYRIAKSILKKDVDCEEAAQEAITIAFSKLHTLRNEKYAKTWLIRILINECYRILKTQKRLVLMNDNANMDIAEEQNDYSELYSAIMALDVKYRVVISLYYIEGFSVTETAQILRVPEGTVKSRLSRARSQLKEQLTDNKELQYEHK